jgi:hypothetical protein
LKVISQPKESRFVGRQLAGGSRPTRGSVLLVAMLMFAFVFPSGLAWSQSSGTTSYEVKTAFLFNFAKFIDWPSSSFVNPQTPFTLCVLGQDPFGHVLDDGLQGKTIGDRPLVVRRLKDKAEARHCQMVFVSSSETAYLEAVIENLQGANVLLVGEANGFAALGGAIEFILEDNHVRFAINADAVDRSGLKFSSKLLALAKIVHDEGHSKGG